MAGQPTWVALGMSAGLLPSDCRVRSLYRGLARPGPLLLPHLSSRRYVAQTNKTFSKWGKVFLCHPWLSSIKGKWEKIVKWCQFWDVVMIICSCPAGTLVCTLVGPVVHPLFVLIVSDVLDIGTWNWQTGSLVAKGLTSHKLTRYQLLYSLWVSAKLLIQNSTTICFICFEVATNPS